MALDTHSCVLHSNITRELHEVAAICQTLWPDHLFHIAEKRPGTKSDMHVGQYVLPDEERSLISLGKLLERPNVRSGNAC